ncbi:hypothetical protein CH35J_002610 [Colletotrichum higginsianum]|uniref:Uncharacterized protein n=1 Tax=Colletotrichum higginsianum TaxID=80884 RepID=A0A4T0WFM3_9PEZI|nr:hypothetical protein CH35J_002610 [Colletotrichum higginsianum]
MAPASQETESASPTTTRPDGESSVDNIAQAYRDLVRGEQAAAALEANLTTLESRLDALLAAFEASEKPEHDGAAAPSTEELKKQDGTTHNAQPSENGSFDSNETAKKS